VIVIGVDPGKDKLDAVALIDGHYLAHLTIDFSKDKLPRNESLVRQRNLFTSWVNQLIWVRVTHAEEVRVFVEDTVRVRSMQVAVWLAQTVGMLLALPYLVYPVPIDSWKQVVAGKGGVGKDEVKAAVIAWWPDSEDRFGKRQDLFDATGIAVYGENVIRREL
jgi:Holliday junction resolvasome RuvABC endonuclease subunit